MTITQAIVALNACLKQFGNVECTFTKTEEGNPALELLEVDTAKKEEDEIRRFNARFPVHSIFVPSRN